jgi:hypothetical protein
MKRTHSVLKLVDVQVFLDRLRAYTKYGPCAQYYS